MAQTRAHAMPKVSVGPAQQSLQQEQLHLLLADASSPDQLRE